MVEKCLIREPEFGLGVRGEKRLYSKLTPLDLRRAYFGLFKDLLGRVSLDSALCGKRGPRKLVNIQGLPPPSSHATQPKKEHTENKKMIGDSQHDFTKGKSYLKNLMAFYDGATALVDEERATDVVSLDLCKAFYTVLDNILGSKLEKHDFDG
ncbi:rna-directed dna polymerase from mobile element jockey-like [Pitangus sulphuratus]|nr:rna-directed dna polymerase from mobile element jockey-like [Pitangus sulphuratus]